MRKVIFLDRDGIINKEIGRYVYQKQDFELLEGLGTALTRWKSMGYSFVIVTNQGGISKGLYQHSDVEFIHTYLRKWFKDQELKLLHISYCPHHNAIESCICRKPDSLMLERLIARYRISVSDSFLLGDSPRDIEAARKVGLSAHLVKANSNLNTLNLF